jgi:hypothetical protein
MEANNVGDQSFFGGGMARLIWGSVNIILNAKRGWSFEFLYLHEVRSLNK